MKTLSVHRNTRQTSAEPSVTFQYFLSLTRVLRDHIQEIPAIFPNHLMSRFGALRLVVWLVGLHVCPKCSLLYRTLVISRISTDQRELLHKQINLLHPSSLNSDRPNIVAEPTSRGQCGASLSSVNRCIHTCSGFSKSMALNHLKHYTVTQLLSLQHLNK